MDRPTLIRLSHASLSNMPSSEAKMVLHLLIETLTDIEPSTRALALKVLQDHLRYEPQMFHEYAELMISKVLEAHKDVLDVAVMAEKTAVVIASSIPPDQSMKVLCPILQTAEVPVNHGAIKMLSKVIEIMSYPEVKTAMPDIVPVLVKACGNHDTNVRRASVFALVAIHSVVGDEMKEYLGDLRGSKMKLLNLYIEKAQSAKLSQAGPSPSPSSPISLSQPGACEPTKQAWPLKLTGRPADRPQCSGENDDDMVPEKTIDGKLDQNNSQH